MSLRHLARRVAVRHQASQFDIMDALLPQRDVVDLMERLERDGDRQSSDLAMACYEKLSDKLKLSDNEEYALARFKNSTRRNDWDAATQRNNLFKAADLLGLKLPSHFFASDEKAPHRHGR